MPRTGSTSDAITRLKVLGSWCLDVRANEVIYDNHLATFLGITPGRHPAESRRFLDLVEATERERVDLEHKSAASSFGTFESCYHLTLPTGDVLCVCELITSTGHDATDFVSGTIIDLSSVQFSSQQFSQLEQTIRSANLGTWFYSTVTSEVAFSSPFATLLGYDEDQSPTSQEDLLRIAHPDSWETIRQHLSLATSTTEINIILRFVCREGGTRWIRLIGSKRSSTQCEGIFEDITDSKLVEISRQTELSSYQTVCESAFDTFYIMKAVRGSQGEVLDFVFQGLNEKAARTIGIDREKAVGTRLSQVAPSSRTDGTFDNFFNAMKSQIPIQDDIVLSNFAMFAVHLKRTIFPLPDGVAVGTTDITSQSGAQRALAQSERFVQRMASAIPDILFVWDIPSKSHTYRNRDFFTELGYSRSDRMRFGEQWLKAVLHPDDYESLDSLEKISLSMDDEEVAETELRFLGADGQYRTFRTRCTVFVRSGNGVPVQALGTLQDVTEQRAYQDQLETQMQRLEVAQSQLESRQRDLELLNQRLGTLATTDSLTGLKNYRAFQERLAEEVDRARRYGTPLALILTDVDHFKNYNDTYGHPAGDQMLRTFAQVLAGASRASDVVVRYGGEEFGLILPNTTASDAKSLAERIRKALKEAESDGHKITASFGCAELKSGATGQSQLISDADRALYRAKKDGRDQVVCSE